MTAGRWQLARTAVLVLGLLLCGLLVAAALSRPDATDFAVYRGAVQELLSGGSLYGFELSGYTEQALPFTYPPFAGLVLAPVGALPLPVGFAVWTVVQLAACALLAWLVCRDARGGESTGQGTALVTVGLAFVALLLSEPVAHGVALGQMSLVIVALVVADNTVLRRWRGLLTGVAAAIKLTPLVFLPYYLLTRQWRAAGNLVLGFGATTALAFAVLPGDSVRYWTQLVLSTGRIGDVASRRNKSLLGLLAHTGLGGTTLTVLWLALAAVVAVLALWRASRHAAAGEELSAVLVVGLLSTVVSPISWPHHLAWVSLAAVHLLRGRPRWARWLGGALLVLFFVNTPLMGYADTGPAWLAVPEALATLCLVALAVAGFPLRPAIQPVGDPAATGAA